MERALVFLSKSGSEIEPDKKEACRYMGVKGEAVTEQTEKVYNRLLSEIKAQVSPKAVFTEVDISLSGGAVDFGFMKIENQSLYKNLSGCSSAVVFAATLGASADRLIMRCQKLSAAEGMICDCIASAAIEAWCDEVNLTAVGDRQAKPRFSPGYAGVSLEYQKDILAFLDAEKKLGITLGDSMMMSPLKSVTAFIGIKG